MTYRVLHTRVIAEDYDFETVRDLIVACERCSVKIPDETLNRLFTKPEFPHICRKCGLVHKLTREELDTYADSLTWTVPELRESHAT
jgi:hypothetical protein